MPFKIKRTACQNKLLKCIHTDKAWWTPSDAAAHVIRSRITSERKLILNCLYTSFAHSLSLAQMHTHTDTSERAFILHHLAAFWFRCIPQHNLTVLLSHMVHCIAHMRECTPHDKYQHKILSKLMLKRERERVRVRWEWRLLFSNVNIPIKFIWIFKQCKNCNVYCMFPFCGIDLIISTRKFNVTDWWPWKNSNFQLKNRIILDAILVSQNDLFYSYQTPAVTGLINRWLASVCKIRDGIRDEIHSVAWNMSQMM